MKPTLAADPVVAERFRREAIAVAQLSHPNIVPVYGLGTYTDGRPFYAMRFIQGDSLKDAVLADDVIDMESGEIYAEAGNQLVEQLLEKLQSHNTIRSVTIVKDAKDKLILNSLVEDQTSGHEEAILKIYQRQLSLPRSTVVHD